MEFDTTRAFEILTRFAKLKVGDFWARRSIFPEDLKQDMNNLVEDYRSSDPDSRSRICTAIKPSFSFVFLWYSKEMAIQAVRESDDKLILNGLTALAIENAVFDLRENIMMMSLLCNSAVKLGVDATALFLEAAALAENKRLTHELKLFPQRPAKTRLIKSFNFAESVSSEGFTYVGRN